MPHFALSALGALQMTLDGQPIAGFESQRARALLVYLAFESDRAHTRDHLAGLLWPDQSNQVARENLRQSLAHLRRVLGDRAADGTPLLSVSRESVQFNSSADYWLDATEFAALLAACDRHSHRHTETCRWCAAKRQLALELYRGDFLDQFFLPDSAPFEEWALLKRERLRQLALEALGRLAEHHEKRQAGDLVLRYARRQLELDPWREEAHRQLMRAYAKSGQRSAALAQYETCRRVLVKEMNVEPSLETTALYEKILASEDLGPSSNLSVAAHLPSVPTGLVDREKELAELADLLANPQCRLITIVGPGGIGKTRLALAAAADQGLEFSGGVFFIPLSSLHSADWIAPAVLSALDLPMEGKTSPQAQLLAHLSRREILLVLDSFEHLLEGTALISAILRSAPRVTILVTSRERLNLQGEWVFELRGLDVPEGQAISQADSYGAVQLFLQCACREQAARSFSDEEKSIIVRICRRVDGIPLAIELAAAWVRTLSCRQIAEEIEKSFGFLSTALRDVPERHRSLRAVFGYSWDLLGEEERAVLRKLSVFSGGFQKEAAEHVAGASLPLLAALLDKSLLRSGGPDRYDLHDLLRQFAQEKLDESGEAQATYDRHVAYFLDWAEQAEPELYGAQQKSWLERLKRDHDNLRAALRRVVDAQDADRALRLVNSLWRFWYIHGYLREGLEWLERALSLSTASRSVDRAKALNSAGVFAFLLGNSAAARDYYEASLELSRELDNKLRLSSVLNNLGMLERSEGNHERAISFFENVLALSREIGDEPGVATALNNLGIAWLESGDLERAESLQEENLALRRQRGDAWGIATALINLSTISFQQSRYARAEELCEQGLALFKEIENKRGIAIALKDLARLTRARGKMTKCRELLIESLRRLQELGDKREIASCLVGFTGLALAREQFDRAARLHAAVEHLLDALGGHLERIDATEYERQLAALHAQLGHAAFDAASSAGRAMALDEVIRCALEA